MKTATKIGIRRISGTNLRFFSALKIIQILIPFEFSIFISGNIRRCSTSKREREKKLRGSGCGSVGRAVASDTRGPWFESSHQQNLLNICLLSTVLKRRK